MIKYINYYLKFIKEFIHPFEAQPIIKINKTDHEIVTLAIRPKKSKKKTFYIIRRTPGAGLFSNFIFVLNHLKIANSCGFIPIVDMENYAAIYNELKKINNTNNSWNYYFNNKLKTKLTRIYKTSRYIITDNKFPKSFTHKINNNEYRNYFNKYFTIKKKYLDFADLFAKKNFKENTLAIHLRGTSYKTAANHPFPTTDNQTINLIKKILSENNYSKIFLCTEDLNYLDILKKKFENKVIFLKNVYRSYHDDAFKIYPRDLHRFKLGRDILIESLLISKCNGFVYTNTNVSEFVKFLDKKKKIKYFSIQNSFNTKNAYVAKWLWYYKNVFPGFLGGFKKTTYVKKN
jgi:hypothetical protein